LNPRLFNGKLNLKDDNIAFDFSGILDYTARVPNFDFDLDMQYLRLKKLNLMEKDLSVAGKMNIDIQLIDNDLSKSDGQAILKNIVISDPDYSQEVDEINMNSTFSSAGRKINITSELFDLNLNGHYELTNLWNSFSNYFHRSFPDYAQRLKMPLTATAPDTNQVNYRLHIFDSENLTQLFVPQLSKIQSLQFAGEYISDQSLFNGTLELPQLMYDSIAFQDIDIDIDLQHSRGKFDLNLAETRLKSGMTFDRFELLNKIEDGIINYAVHYGSRSNPNSRINIDGTISPHDSTALDVSLSPENLKFLRANWQINEDNYIRFGNKKIALYDFNLNDQYQRNIQLNNIGDNGINLLAAGFSLGVIDSLWDYSLLNFGGKLNLDLNIENIFQLTDIQANISSDSLMINEDYWGNLNTKLVAKDTKSTFKNILTLVKNDSRLKFDATYNPPNFEGKNGLPNYLDAKVSTDAFPLDFLQYFLLGASDIAGTLDAEMTLKGNPTQLDVDGEATARNGAVTVDFLNTRYFVDNQIAKINNRWIDVTNAIISDEEGNTATLKRGITHNRLKNLGLNVELNTNRFLALNTTKELNDVFYGKAIGSGNVEFTGSFERTNIVVNAEADKGTKITIPVTSDKNAPEISFIKFKDKTQVVADSTFQNPDEIKGVDLDLFLTLNDLAEVELIFDERAGDIIKGRGRGDLQIYLDRSGDMAMYGNYFIEEGEYLFTLLNFVNKPFIVQRGGTIAWRGDPFNAQIDINAVYKDLNASVAALIPEYLVYASDDAKEKAVKTTDIDLIMNLKGELYQPSIQFELAFPQLQGDLRNYVDNKLRTLRQDENELNKQVFGLIVLGQFLPSDFSLTGTSSGEFGINTVSEFVANQLSIYVTDLLGEAIDDVDFISSIDVDLDYNRFEDQIDFGSENFYLNGQEYYIRQKASLWDDQVTVIVGNNFTTNSITQNDSRTRWGGDVVVEGVVNKNRTLKLNVFYIREPNLLEGNGNQAGVGISYEKEYDSIKDIFTFGKKKRAKNKQNENN